MVRLNNFQGSKSNNIYITTNYDCNLDCVYCYEKGKRHGQVFSIEKAKNLLNDFLNKDLENMFTIINFSGGEPFLVFEEIKELCEWAWSQQFKHSFLFYATSNGTLIHGEIANWLQQNKNKFWVGLSIDGNQEMHDLNRSNSFDFIDIDFFSQTWPEQGVKMTLSPLSIQYLASGLIFLHSKFKKITCNFAQLMEWDDMSFSYFEGELKKIYSYYISNPEIQPCSLIVQSLPRVLDDNLQKWCGAGTSMKVYDVNGDDYPCHLFFESISDNCIREEVVNIDFSKIESHLDPVCIKCSIVKLCPTCYGANFITSGNIATRNKQYCKFYFAQIKFSCLIELERIKRIYNSNYSILSDVEKFNTVEKLNAIKQLTSIVNS